MKRRDFLSSTLALGLTPRIVATGKQRTGYVYDDRYLKHELGLRRGQTHPESPERLLRINEALAANGLDQEVVRIELFSEPLPPIQNHHTDEHVASVRQIPTTGAVAELAVAGALGAIDAVAKKQVQMSFVPFDRPDTMPTTRDGKKDSASTAMPPSPRNMRKSLMVSKKSSSSTGITTMATAHKTPSMRIQPFYFFRLTTGKLIPVPEIRR